MDACTERRSPGAATENSCQPSCLHPIPVELTANEVSMAQVPKGSELLSGDGTGVAAKLGQRAAEEGKGNSSIIVNSRGRYEEKGRQQQESSAQEGNEWDFPHQAPCGFSPSLCFSTVSKDKTDVRDPTADNAVVNSQWQINNAKSASDEDRESGSSLPVTYCSESGAEPSWILDSLFSTEGRSDYCNYNDAEKRGNGVWYVKDLTQNPGHGEKPDLTIEVAGQRISVHKSVLAGKSDYFKARLSRDVLKVKGVSYSTLRVLIHYIYSSKMEVKKENVVEVISGAKVLQIPCAVQSAIDTVKGQLSLDNCFDILSIAKKERLGELKDAAYKYMSDNFLQVLRDQTIYGRLTGAERDLILKLRLGGKKCLMVAEVSDVFDRGSSNSRPPSRESSRPQSPASVLSTEESHLVYCYKESAEDWRPLTHLPEEAVTKGCGVCTLYNYLFIAGGIQGYGERARLSDRVFCYNPVTDTWAEIRPLSQPRSQLKLVSLDGYLYAIGGECLFTVERYDPRADRWTAVAPLPKGAFAVAHEATTCGGEIYVSGGSLFYRLLKYDPRRNEWQECPYNNSRRKSAGMVAHRSFIYRFDVSRESGLQVFKYNSIGRRWSECAIERPSSFTSTTYPSLQPFRCTLLDNSIYCVSRSAVLQFTVIEEGTTDTLHTHEFKPPSEARGALFPFVLSLPERAEKHV
ncbi:kelch repeat and BTB domain-containing protein 11 [Protopterus annectens]|uniref:kelch repeat and BTB domain-containing protein 11 n=1 Tax=Protopterus annectens TaxID=7888 RepID=UPI001CFA68F2|nr:kelch repeat and BTB domain-containing protein 11 [Protopterus annectens]